MSNRLLSRLCAYYNKLTDYLTHKPGVTVLIPVGDDRPLDTTVDSVLRQQCSKLEILILRNGCNQINDGKEITIRAESNLSIKKIFIQEKGKGNALNVGLRYARYEFVCVLDADCILDDCAIHTAMQHFADENVSAVGGKLKAIGEKKNLLTFCQRVEYMKTFNIWRQLFDNLNANCLISGVYGLFRKADIDTISGYDDDTVGEDMELVLSMQDTQRSKGKRIRYEALSICYTGVPTTMRRLLRQRDRWQRWLLDCILKHRNMFLNPRLGMLGLAAMPYQIFVELLGPIFVLLHAMNLICAAVGAQWWFAIIISFRDWIGLGHALPQMWGLYFAYLGFELSLTCIANYIEYGRWLVVIMKLPEAIMATAFGILLSVPLAMARFWGMISFPIRRLVW